MLNGGGRMRRRDFSGFAGIESSVWPVTGEIDTETASLATTISTLGSDIAFSSTPIDSDAYQAFNRDWNAFVTDFLQWKETPYVWNPTRRDQLLAYRARFNQLLAAYHNIGGADATTSIAPVPHDQPEPNSLDTVMTVVKWAGIALIVGGGLKLLNDSGILKRRAEK